MADEESSFKVVDRRGRARESAPAEPTSLAPERVPPPPATGFPEPEPGGPTLQHLFGMLANSAAINLGEAVDPSTGDLEIDLEQAKDAIDMLVVLRDKTEGNRTEEESRLLEQILYGLQMRFVQLARGGG